MEALLTSKPSERSSQSQSDHKGAGLSKEAIVSMVVTLCLLTALIVGVAAVMIRLNSQKKRYLTNKKGKGRLKHHSGDATAIQSEHRNGVGSKGRSSNKSNSKNGSSSKHKGSSSSSSSSSRDISNTQGAHFAALLWRRQQRQRGRSNSVELPALGACSPLPRSPADAADPVYRRTRSADPTD